MPCYSSSVRYCYGLTQLLGKRKDVGVAQKVRDYKYQEHDQDKLEQATGRRAVHLSGELRGLVVRQGVHACLYVRRADTIELELRNDVGTVQHAGQAVPVGGSSDRLGL